MSYDLSIVMPEFSLTKAESLFGEFNEICEKYDIQPAFSFGEIFEKMRASMLQMMNIDIPLPEDGVEREFASFGLNQHDQNIIVDFYSELLLFCKNNELLIFNPQEGEFIDKSVPTDVPPGW